jgi:hypothetical protein
MKRKILLVLPVLLLIGVVYLNWYALTGKSLFLGLHDGMPPDVVAARLDTKLMTRKNLGDAARFYDPSFDATYSKINNVEITPETRKRFREYYAVVEQEQRPTGIELRFFDQKLYGMDLYTVMQDNTQDAFTSVCRERETDFLEQYPKAQRKDLSDLNGGYGWSSDTDNVHAYVMCDLNAQTVTVHVWSKEKFLIGSEGS